MPIQDANTSSDSARTAITSSDSARTAIDRHAVKAAGQLLLSAIWLEHRVRRFSTRLTMVPSQRGTVVSVVSTSGADHTDRELLVPDGRDDRPSPHQKKGTTNDCVREGR
jgi:hypothetical protein